MTTKSAQNSTSTSGQAPKRKVMLYLLIGMLAIMSFAHYSPLNQNSTPLNYDFYQC